MSGTAKRQSHFLFPTNFECLILNLHTLNYHTLRIHISAVHEKNSPYKCAVCDYASGTKSGLTAHFAKIHGNSNVSDTNIVESFPCSNCENSFSTESEMKLHMKSDHKKPHTCSVCGKTFPKLSKLNLHVSAVHEKNKVCSEKNETTIF